MKMKRILYILLLAMGMTMIAPQASIVDNTVAAAYSADDKAKSYIYDNQKNQRGYRKRLGNQSIKD